MGAPEKLYCTTDWDLIGHCVKEVPNDYLSDDILTEYIRSDLAIPKDAIPWDTIEACLTSFRYFPASTLIDEVEELLRRILALKGEGE